MSTTIMTTTLSTTLPSVTSHIATSTTTHHPATSTVAGAGSGSSPPNNSPLLFFVALGFGVVFTNLWIIVGVKYCFRYNARNRQMREAAANGEPIDMNAMPGRPHRRRREKKLMSMEEVNERFPLIKYKSWRASRENQGLPAAGGVIATPSRAASIREHANVDQVVPPARSSATTSHDQTPTPDLPGGKPKPLDTSFKPASGDAEKAGISISNVEVPESPYAVGKLSSERDGADDDEEDPIQTAVPQELLAQPGDACAICIDNLDDEDDVRGLTCGHAFHAGCLDPWLTSRRACCPLCKRDYYVPKPRDGGEAAPDVDNSRHPVLETPGPIWLGSFANARFGRGPSSFHPRHRATLEGFDRFGLPTTNGAGGARRQRDQRNSNSQTAQTATEGSTQTFSDRVAAPFRGLTTPAMPSIKLPAFLRRGSATDASGSNESSTTPAQLEAGER